MNRVARQQSGFCFYGRGVSGSEVQYVTCTEQIDLKWFVKMALAINVLLGGRDCRV
jgi:hypothetical protein